jgi:ABC-type uncharacterized transport system substrate-binding protein
LPSPLLAAPPAVAAQPAPGVHRIGWLSPAAATTGGDNLDALRQGLRELGYVEGRNLTIEPHRLRGPHDIEETFAALARRRPDALMTTADPLIASYRARIVELAAKHRLVSMYPGRESVDAGGLMFYGGSIPDMYRRAGRYVDRIRKGAKPSELPVEQPTKFDMVVNLKTARALGLTIPPSVLARADEVVHDRPQPERSRVPELCRPSGQADRGALEPRHSFPRAGP